MWVSFEIPQRLEFYHKILNLEENWILKKSTTEANVIIQCYVYALIKSAQNGLVDF